MSSILKVDQIQLADGNTASTSDLGLTTSMPTGSVVQTQYVRRNGDVSKADTSWSTIDTISFTPLYANSKIHLMLNYSHGGQSGVGQWWRFWDTTNNVAVDLSTGQQFPNTDAAGSRMVYQVIVDASNTNTRTYATQFRNGSQSGTTWAHTYGASAASWFIIQEIAG